MKRLVPALLLFAALPLAADDAAKKETAQPVVDSPLVAAAKRSSKAKKPAIVITNETLAKSGGNAHITTANKSIAELPNLPAPPPSVASLPVDPNLKVVQQPKAVPHEAKKRLDEAMARAEEDGPYGDDPARIERQLDQMQKAAAKETEKKPEKP